MPVATSLLCLALVGLPPEVEEAMKNGDRLLSSRTTIDPALFNEQHLQIYEDDLAIGWLEAKLSRAPGKPEAYTFHVETKADSPPRSHTVARGRLDARFAMIDGTFRVDAAGRRTEIVYTGRTGSKGYSVRVVEGAMGGELTERANQTIDIGYDRVVNLDMLFAPLFAGAKVDEVFMLLTFDPLQGKNSYSTVWRESATTKTIDGKTRRITPIGLNSGPKVRRMFAYDAASKKIVSSIVEGQTIEARATTPEALEASRRVKPAPSGNILFQPTFVWDNDRRSRNGTGFVTVTPDGQRLGVGSAHYVLSDTVLPTEVTFVSIATGRPAFKTDRAFGPLGDGDPKTPSKDGDRAAEDFFFVPAKDVKGVDALALDERAAPKRFEPVWFPNKNFDNGRGFELEEGVVVVIEDAVIGVLMDRDVPLQSQSGTPFVSQKTGKVIGILQGTDTLESGQPIILLVSSAAIRKGLAMKRVEMSLRDAAAQERGPKTPH